MRWRTRERHPLLNLRGMATDEPGRDGALAAGISGVRIRTFRSGFADVEALAKRPGWDALEAVKHRKFAVISDAVKPAGSATFFRNRRTRSANFIRKCSARKTKYQECQRRWRKTDATTHAQPASFAVRDTRAILFCVMVIALKFGAVHVSLYGWAAICCACSWARIRKFSSNYSLILNLRLPRIFEVIVGASLSVAGTSFQALLRNPLADPYVLEFQRCSGRRDTRIAARAASCAVARKLLRCSPRWADFLARRWRLPRYISCRREGRIDSSTLLLGGVITASLLSAVIILLLNTMPSSNVRGMAYWLMGELRRFRRDRWRGCCA